MNLRRASIVFLLLLGTGCGHAPVAGEGPVDPLAGIPLIDRYVESSRPELVVLLTGDGGWRWIDQRLAKRFNEAGVPVVGFDSPAYFTTLRTSEESSRDLQRVIDHYLKRWKKGRVLLVGYSRGADVLPFMASRLPSSTLERVDVIALLGMEATIEFRFVPWWKSIFRQAVEPTYPVVPEVEKLAGRKIVCVYGTADPLSACQQLRPGLVQLIAEKGGHHFSGDYAGIADKILAAAGR